MLRILQEKIGPNEEFTSVSSRNAIFTSFVPKNWRPLRFEYADESCLTLFGTKFALTSRVMHFGWINISRNLVRDVSNSPDIKITKMSLKDHHKQFIFREKYDVWGEMYFLKSFAFENVGDPALKNTIFQYRSSTGKYHDCDGNPLTAKAFKAYRKKSQKVFLCYEKGHESSRTTSPKKTLDKSVEYFTPY